MNDKPEKERGALLTVWLLLMLVANIASVMFYFVFEISTVGRQLFLPNVPLWAIYSFTVLGLLNIVFTMMLFMWRKLGFFALCISAGTAFAVNLIVGVGVFSIVGLVSIPILYLILRPKWNLLK